MTTIKRTEYSEQQALFEWAEWAANQHPCLRYLMAIPNGQYRPGQRMEAGLRAGVPDIFLPYPRNNEYGLWIEMKVGDNRVTAEQSEWLAWLEQQGYRVRVCYGFDEARREIEEYL